MRKRGCRTKYSPFYSFILSGFLLKALSPFADNIMSVCNDSKLDK